MKSIRVSVAVLLLACSFSFAQQKCVGWSTGYFAQYAGGSYSNIFWKAYTHLVHFALIPSDTGGISGISATQAKNFVAACHQNGKKALICMGGAGTSPNFSAACSTSHRRTALVRNIVKFMKDNGYDGVDMDWECGEESDDAAMVAKFKGLHQEIHDSLGSIVPRPLLTSAVANWYPNACASIVDLCDQMNGMSYYGLVGTMNGYFNTLTSRGVPKSKLGVGFGYDSDNEVDVNNPDDIGAKCLYAINNGYGGTMVWYIQGACAQCNDTAAFYVCTPSVVAGGDRFSAQGDGAISLMIFRNDHAREIRYTIPDSHHGAASVDLGIFDMRGELMRTLVHSIQDCGMHTAFFDEGRSERAAGSGIYIIKLTVDGSTAVAKAFIGK